MIKGEKLNEIRRAIVMINRGLKVIGIEATIVINQHNEEVTIYHSYANNDCIDIEKPSYTFPLTMLFLDNIRKEDDWHGWDDYKKISIWI